MFRLVPHLRGTVLQVACFLIIIKVFIKAQNLVHRDYSNHMHQQMRGEEKCEDRVFFMAQRLEMEENSSNSVPEIPSPTNER